MLNGVPTIATEQLVVRCLLRQEGKAASTWIPLP